MKRRRNLAESILGKMCNGELEGGTLRLEPLTPNEVIYLVKYFGGRFSYFAEDQGVALGAAVCSDTVWIVDYADYPESGGGPETDRVYRTREQAVAAVKARYGGPYRVVWTETDGTLRGEFKAVAGYSTKHTGIWVLREAVVKAIESGSSGKGEQ